MPINKNAMLRYITIDKCLRNPGRFYFWEDLVDECIKSLNDYDANIITTISRRTLLSDINFLKSEKGFQAPIVAINQGHRKYYRYSDMNYSISNQPLRHDEMDLFKDALLFLSRISGILEFDWVREVIPRLQVHQKYKNLSKLISYETNENLKNIEFLGDFVNAIRYNNVLEVNYKAFYDSESIKYIMHPHFLKQYNTRWFLFGLVEEFNEKGINPVNFALDRIISYSVLDKITYIENAIDYSSYFDNIIGVTKLKGNKLVKIHLKIHRKQLDYIITKPIHRSQLLVKQIDEFFYLITIEVIPNYELYMRLMSYGAAVEIIKPIEIRKEVECLTKHC